MNRVQRIAVGGVLLAAVSVCAYGQGGRVLHFPADCSLGRVRFFDANISSDIETFSHWIRKSSNSGLKEAYDAKGDIRVPAGKEAYLVVHAKNLKNLDKLKALGANDLYGIRFYNSSTDDRCMEHIAHFTGLKELHLKSTMITSRGLFKIKNLQQLERLYLGKGITDAGMRVVGRLKSLKYLYLTGSSVTNTGIAKICKTLSLEELVIAGCRVDDEGLKYLAGMGTLKYLKLTGDNFTDAGMEHVKNIPSLKILHVGWVTNIRLIRKMRW